MQGDPKCIVDLTNKRTAKLTKLADDVTDKAARDTNDTAKVTSKSIKKLFK
jgi:hypothetical protein